MNRILVPLDGSPTAELILKQVEALLKTQDSEVILAQCLEIPAAASAEYAIYLPEWTERAKKYLGATEAGLKDRGILARSVIRQEPAAQGIVNAAVDEKAGLIAMTTHGRTGLARFVVGSVAEKVMRSSPVPVLLVRSFMPTAQGPAVAAAPVGRPFRKIVVAMDGSATSAKVVPVAADLARRTGAKIILINVSDWQLHYRAPAHPVPDPSVEQEFAVAETLLKSMGIETLVLRLRGEVASILVDFCTDHDVDLLAMGTHGRSGVTRWALGSVVEKTLRAATCPMLVVRDGAKSTLAV